VERPKHRRRSSRRNLQKSDPSEAERAARAVLAGEASGVPKSSDGRVEMIRTLRAARRSAMKARTQAANQLQGLRLTAPEGLRNRLRRLSTKELVSVAARFRLAGGPSDVPAATKFALRSVARRYEALSGEIAEQDAHLDRLVGQVAPELVALAGIGTDSAATLLIVAGDNPHRLGSEASFASLCGVSPIEASSGKVVRHRLNRGGNREANRALLSVAGHCLVLTIFGFSTIISPVIGRLYLAGQPGTMEVNEAIFSSPAFVFLVVPGLLLYLLGTILFGVAIWRSGTLPRWAGVLYAPTGLLIAAGVQIGVAQTLGSALVVVAGGWIAWSVMRQPSSQLGAEAQPRVR
jgi:hypothetical protein